MTADKIFLETKRLKIRVPTLDDLDVLCHFNANPEVMRYIDPTEQTRSMVNARLEKAIAHYKKHGFTLGIAIEKSSGKFIGQAGIRYLRYDDTQPDIEMGYLFYPEYWS